jgi:hypothetical protein
MTPARVRAGLAALATLGMLAAVLLLSRPVEPLASGPSREGPKARKSRPAGKPIAMAADRVSLEIIFGLKDEEPTIWDGEVQVSRGKVRSLRLQRAGPQQSKVKDATFNVRSFRRALPMQQGIVRPILHVDLEAPEAARITLKTEQGDFFFTLKDLPPGTRKPFLDGQVSVERLQGAVLLTGKDTEDDFPALARGPNGTIWMAYVEYQPGPKVVRERVMTGNFDELVPKNNGDQVLLVRFDGKSWQPPLEVTGPGLDVWRPTVAVDGKGRVHIAWSQQVDGNWDIYYRRYTPPGKGGDERRWSDTVRFTKTPGTDMNVVATTDSTGTVWLAWQGWRKDNFDILLAALADGHSWKEPHVISSSKANDWNPAITADSRGNVYVAWDTYDKGNYDVRLYVAANNAKGRALSVANSARFEARPSLACDARDRVWIAYEEGDEQWGKDFATGQFRKIPLKNNPGAALYLKRTIKVKCLADGKLKQPAGGLEKAFANTLRRNKSVPRLAIGADGAPWLLLRHHPLPGGAGEVWNSYALRYDGKKWSAPRRLGNSANLMDNRPALVPFGQGLLAVYSSDYRNQTADRQQSDLFAALLALPGKVQAMELAAVEAPPKATVPVVHKNEAADVARMRAYRIASGGKKLRLLRGEFHRHTEYSSHNDGDGSLEDAWRYALDAADLDWIGIGDHDNGFGSEYMWWHFQKTTDLYHNQPRFVGAYVYERSVVYPDGHRNVILPRRGVRPLIRGDMKGTKEKGTPDTKMLYAYLKHFGGICSSHTSATSMGTDWRDNNSDLEPVVEIYQGLRHNYEEPKAPRAPTQETNIGGYRPKGYVWNAFEKGYRLGFQSSSDHTSTHMSFGVVLTDNISRQGIIDAFRKRHSYAATDNIIMEVRSGDHIMGDIFTTAKRPTLEIKVHGTGPIAKVHVIRNNKYVYSAEPKKAEVTLGFTDLDARKGKTSYYYVRVEQADGNLAWASPMWITYKP